MGRYRANDLLIAFDSLHLGGDGGRGHLPHVFLVQNLQDAREYPNVIGKEKENKTKKNPKKQNKQMAFFYAELWLEHRRRNWSFAINLGLQEQALPGIIGIKAQVE